MCLIADKAKTEEFLATAPEAFTVYKILHAATRSLLSPFQAFDYKVGENIAEGKPQGSRDGSHNTGMLHCFLSYNDVLTYQAEFNAGWSSTVRDPCAVIVELECRREDVLAVGWNESETEVPQLGARKLTLKQETWEKIFGIARGN